MIETSTGILLAVAAIAFLAQYTDASIGMGYGTTLTPLLVLIGFAPVDVIPAVLLGQLLGGAVGGYFHHRIGNITLDFRRDENLPNDGRNFLLACVPRSLDSKVVLLLIAGGALGSVVGVVSALNISSTVLTIYIGAMVLCMGLLILARRNRETAFSFKRLLAVGLVSAFNKGMTGGGYGPLVTGGQILSGREIRNSVGTTTVAECAIVLIALVAYLTLRAELYWALVAAVTVGSIAAGPLAAVTVKKIGSVRLKLVVALAMTILGVWTLIDALLLN
ncbi:MAG: sulfite exporter TauE/SafE family protein [Dehalococcoidia bacterium]|nr:sulfite exporter TauE/SafE family protein [Dehalococcoidia bacterium]